MQELFQALPDILERLGSDEAAFSAFVFAAWRRVAGEQLRQRTEPVDFAQKRLTLAVENEMWRRHLQDLSGGMLYSLNSLLGQGTVKFIDFRIDPAAVDAASQTGSRMAKHAVGTQELTPELRKAANAIADDGLRESFLGAAAAYLARQKR
jgi:hypothetical protein